MSWARFGADGSDVYLFPSDRGGECCGCALVGFPKSFATPDLAEFLAHLDAHEAAGHFVPTYVRDDVGAEWADYFPVAAGAGEEQP